jgi:maltooligosyltrehalose trehalohydrolase
MKSPGASLHLGATVREDGIVFRVWAPARRTVDVVVDGRRPLAMTRQSDGTFEVTVPGLAAGARYQYRLDGERHRPDPASRYQPDGVHGPSVAVDPGEFAWTDQAFRGRDLADYVIYELHVGTFTRAGTFEAIIPHLPQLVDLGITAVELMPVAEFPGSRNWGYDGVHLFAPQSTYGGPRGLRRLVDACHARGLSVVLDVVYNHLGPEGNYLGDFGPYFTDRYHTPWGGALDFDGPESAGVRRHFVENARAWVRDFHIDGLRLDAIHSIFDSSPRHILTELAVAGREEARAKGRSFHIMAESHDNDRRVILPEKEGGLGLDAVWSDDFHHALHVRLTGERGGYYCDFSDLSRLSRAITDGFAFQGESSEYFGRKRGTPSRDLPGERFVICVQNHDQVGNRAQGDRLSTVVAFEAVKLAAALMFAAPAVPLLFMGEEYGETAPFQFFTSFLDRDLAEAVRAGRTAEFKRFAWEGAIPDPGDPATFVRSRLSHQLANAPRHRELYQFYQQWLAVRLSHPALGARGKARTLADLDAAGAVLTVIREAGSGPGIRLVANLTADARSFKAPAGWRVLLDSEDVRFAGRVRDPLGPHQAILYEVGAPQRAIRTR